MSLPSSAPLWVRVASMSIFTKHIGHISSLIPKKEMIIQKARWVIAMMENKQTIGDWAVRKFPRETVNVHQPPI